MAKRNQNTTEKTQRQRKKRAAPAGTTRAKGDLVEQIVAEMHKTPEILVEQNVFLPVQDSSKRQREIDVLLTGKLAGYPIRVAIECKNEKEPTGVEQIDAFIGKLHDIGIPTQNGIFVTASKYTYGALVRAEKEGIRPLLLQDGNLTKAVLDAFQSFIYLLLEITEIEIENDMPGILANSEMFNFYNDKGQLRGSIADLVWREWRNERIKAKLGKTKLTLSLPDSWLQITNGQLANVNRITVEVEVVGYVLTYSGEVQRFILTNASDARIEKDHIKIKFPEPEGTFPIARFSTEEALTEFLRDTRGIRVTIGRFRVPRIVYRLIYWPVSKNMAQKLYDIAVQSWQKGQAPDISKYSLADMEGDNLAAAWEPIWEEHPLTNEWPEFQTIKKG